MYKKNLQNTLLVHHVVYKQQTILVSCIQCIYISYLRLSQLTSVMCNDVIKKFLSLSFQAFPENKSSFVVQKFGAQKLLDSTKNKRKMYKKNFMHVRKENIKLKLRELRSYLQTSL